MIFIGFSPRLFAESIEAAMSDGFEDGSQWRGEEHSLCAGHRCSGVFVNGPRLAYRATGSGVSDCVSDRDSESDSLGKCREEMTGLAGPEVS